MPGGRRPVRPAARGRTTEDPLDLVVDLVAGAAGGPDSLAMSDRAWATTVLALQRRLPGARWIEASAVTSPDPGRQGRTRARRAAGRPVRPPTGWRPCCRPGGSRWWAGPRPRCRPTWAALLVAEGHRQVNFAIVGSGPNAASPHHEPGGRVIGRGETVVCDFGGTLSLDGDVGYCSDITRTVVTGEPSAEVGPLLRGAAGGPAGGGGGGPGRGDRRARGRGGPGRHRRRPGSATCSSTGPATASASRSTRTRTWWSGNDERPGARATPSRWSPGIYRPGRFGMRLEDIVVIGRGRRYPNRSTPSTTVWSWSTR